jgi:hypothetical protein
MEWTGKSLLLSCCVCHCKQGVTYRKMWLTCGLRHFLYVVTFYVFADPVAVLSKAEVCGRSLAGIVGSNPARIMDCLSVVSVVCCQVEVPASGWSLVQRSPTECASECDREAARTGKSVTRKQVEKSHIKKWYVFSAMFVRRWQISKVLNTNKCIS